MKAGSDLFELIKSLNKSEKRYFKMYANLQKGSKNYLRLFNEIDKNGIYNEDNIKAKFSGEKFVRQLSFTKNYLYRLITRSLVAYAYEKSVDAKIIEQISASKVMLSKGLTKLYFKNLNTALKTSTRYERFNLSLQILELKNLYTKISGVSKGNETLSSQIQSELKKLNNFHEYNAMLCSLIDLYRKRGKIRNADLRNIISEFGKKPLLKDSSFALSFRAAENFYFIHQLLSDFKGDDGNIYKYCVERLKIITKHPEPFEDMSINYKHDALTYALSYSARKNDKRQFLYYMKILDSIPVKNKSDEISLFFLKSFLNNILIITNKDWENGIRRIPEIKNKLKEYKNNVEGDIHMLILYQMLIMFIMSGRYKEALDESHDILSNPRIKMRPDIEWYVKLITIIIHYELKNYKYFGYLLKSTHRYLSKKGKLFKLEKLLLNFVRELPRTGDENEVKDLLIALKNNLNEIKKDPLEKNAFKYFDFIYWVNLKLGDA